jgi:type II secretory pathway pseudopilin PulG
MKLQGQDGYAMAALIVGLSVMAVLVTVAMPVWKQNAQREKEAELIFRGLQYSRAVNLFQRKHGPGTLPPNIDVLIEEHDLRKKYKDPITKDDFKVLLQGQGPAGTNPAGRGTTGRGNQPPTPTPSLTPAQIAQRSSAPNAGPAGVGGVIGVQSKSTDSSIRIYNGRTHYNEWAFIFQPPAQAPGTGGRQGGPGRLGGPGAGRPTGPGQRGNTFTPSAPRGGRPNPPPGGRGNVPPPGGRGQAPSGPGTQPPPRRPGG